MNLQAFLQVIKLPQNQPKMGREDNVMFVFNL